MTSCFLALPLPETVRKSLGQLRPARSPGVKLVNPDQFHVTLHYLGRLSKNELETVRSVIREVHVPPFCLCLKGLGMFPETGKPRVLWVGVADHPSLIRLHDKLGASLSAGIDFEPEPRRYQPHITLARLKSPVTREQLAINCRLYEKFVLRDVPVDRFLLYESKFIDKRHEYRIVETVEL